MDTRGSAAGTGIGFRDTHTARHAGLSGNEAARKLKKHGPNIITGKKKKSALKILLSQFCDLMILILLASTVISVFMGETTEAVTIIAIVVINSLLGFVQEFKTERTMEALKNLAAPTAKVFRDGREASVPAEQVVPGDLVVLEAGDKVPADAVLIESRSLTADESLLTGESVPVDKQPLASAYAKQGRGVETGDKRNCVFMGTVVTGGRGKGVVYATGMSTEMGRIACMLQEIDGEQTPLQKRLGNLGRFIVYGCLAICAVVFITGVLRGEPLFTMLLAGISLAVAAVPEGLPATVTIALALGVQRMLRRNALIRKLPAVETLGCASIICSDKTGTLTENKMTVRRIYAGDGIITVEGGALSTEGAFTMNGRPVTAAGNAPLGMLLDTAWVCNNSRLEPVDAADTAGYNGWLARRSGLPGLPFTKKKVKWEVSGDPTENALLVMAAKGGLNRDVMAERYARMDELPFDPGRKLMSVLCKTSGGEMYVFTKGAPDVIVEKCSKILTARGIAEMTGPVRSRTLQVNEIMAGEAMRVLGFACRKVHAASFDGNDLENDLVFAGLAGMMDPPRKEAAEAVAKCRLAGIKPVMITGDHKATALAIAKELRIFGKGDGMLTGAEIDSIGEEELRKTADGVSVYARVSPGHKLMIVRALKAGGHVVAMTGDGVNDAPAVKEADIGVSMGITGTDVTKEASSMILQDDNFATIVAAVEEGRVIYENIRKFIRYMLACNLGEVMTMFVGMLLGFPLPLLPIQILWVNLVTDGLPAIALSLDPSGKDIMLRPPRSGSETVFSSGLLYLICFRGAIIGACTLAVFACIFWNGGGLACARTGAFITLVLTQLIHVFECKSERRSILEIPILNNPALVYAVLCSLAMLLGVIYIPLFQDVFKTVVPGLKEWLLIGGFTLIGPAVSGFLRPSSKQRR